MKLIVGLGNPGQQYTNTRHNVGFMAILSFAHILSIRYFKKKLQSLYVKTFILSHPVILLMPMSYMNNVGLSVLQIAQFYSIKPYNIIVIHDELDLPLGKIKIKIGGTTGGHNGLKSIHHFIGDNYMRIRIGISHPKDKKTMNQYIINRFSLGEYSVIDTTLQKLAQHISYLLQNSYSQFVEICST